MDAIKKKMQAMKLEKDNAMDKADTCENQYKDANMRAEKVLEEVGDLQKKFVQVEVDLETSKQQLEQANKDLEEKEKNLASTEQEVATLNRKVQQIEKIWKNLKSAQTVLPQNCWMLQPQLMKTTVCAKYWKIVHNKMKNVWINLPTN